MKKKLILFLILVLVGFFVCCNEQSNKLEDLLANLEKKDDTNEFEKNKLLWESVIKKVWLKETWNSSETYEDMSFVITRVETHYCRWRKKHRKIVYIIRKGEYA